MHEQREGGWGKESALSRLLMLLALTSFSKNNSKRTETNSCTPAKGGKKKLVIHKQLWTKPAAEDRSQGDKGSK